MTNFVRAAALRSTALATSLALVAGLSTFAAAAAPKVPLPKPRPIARNVVPKTTPVATAAAQNAAPVAATRSRRARFGAGDAPACSVAAARAQTGHTGCDCRDVVDLAGRHRSAGKRHRTGAQAQARRCHAGASRDLRSGREENSPNGSSCAATTTARRWSATAPSSRPIQAGLRRPSCAGASRRRCGTTVATTPRCGRCSKTNRRCRPRANSRWQRR